MLSVFVMGLSVSRNSNLSFHNWCVVIRMYVFVFVYVILCCFVLVYVSLCCFLQRYPHLCHPLHPLTGLDLEVLTTGAISSSNMLHIRVSSLSPPHLPSVLHDAPWTVFVQFMTMCLVLCFTTVEQELHCFTALCRELLCYSVAEWLCYIVTE